MQKALDPTENKACNGAAKESERTRQTTQVMTQQDSRCTHSRGSLLLMLVMLSRSRLVKVYELAWKVSSYRHPHLQHSCSVHNQDVYRSCRAT